MLQSDGNLRKGWSRKFDLYKDFTPMISSIESSLDKLFSSVFLQQCDGDLIELLGKLQLNGFLKALKAAEKDKFDPDAVYGDFMKYHSEFIAIYEELKRYAEGYNIRYLSPLTEKEIGQYFRELYEDTCRDKGTVCVLIDSTDVR